MRKLPKIILGTPTFEGKEYCLEFWVKTVRQIQKMTKFDIVLIDNSPTNYYSKLIKKKYKIKVIKSKHYKNMPLTSLGESRKRLYKYAIKNKYDYLFSLEQDIFPPSDIIKRLLKIRNNTKDKEAIIGVPYTITPITEGKTPYIKIGHLTNVALKRIYSKKMRRMIQCNLTRDEMKKRIKIFRAYACGLGCTLLDISIIKKIKVKYTEKRFRPDDAFLFLDCFKKNISVYVDPNLMDKVIHIEGSNKTISSWGKEAIKK